ncbi:hypothetical protein Mal64_13200 [Pseudobythopirellula maris]|uniref:Uncharacterized protein n=1 Tax=Pseudobythopirellula maris TaxID=2527991 RepID=A0A5C5ZVF7_9BACT|nr:hypothetical protein [Pseudobythopirellula maris]TWT90921.1 hypothetical protein Mal64_13200 [Pseudobythopirellula maris]
MSTHDIVLFAFAVLVAVSTLMKLMRRRRDLIVTSVQKQIDDAREKAEAEAQRRKDQAA